ncbi:phage integrase family protein, partial [mine drainage metagenome]
MGNVRQKRGKLFFDFRYRGERCREYTALAYTASNRKRLQFILAKIETEISLGTFEYAQYFPGSKLSEKFTTTQTPPVVKQATALTPLFRTFIEDWFTLSLPSWRKSHAATVRSTIDCHLTPHLGDIPVAEITKTHILQMRVEIAKCKGRGG